MIIGDPYKFSILIKNIKEWNSVESSFYNGVLLFCIDGELFPKKIVTATLSYEIPELNRKLSNIAINDELFNMEKETAFSKIYDITFPEWDIPHDYRYDISPSCLSDSHCYAFAVSNGKQIRIMAAKLIYIIENSRHNLDSIDISEAFISNNELSKIITEMNIAYSEIV